MFEVFIPAHRDRRGGQQPDHVFGSGETAAKAEYEAAQRLRGEDERTQLCMVARFRLREVRSAECCKFHPSKHAPYAASMLISIRRNATAECSGQAEPPHASA